MKLVFLAYSHYDKVLARLIYFRLINEQLSGIEIFMDEFSIRGEDIKKRCLSAAKTASVGVVILSEYALKSEFVLQEIGILLGRDTPTIYVALHEDWKIPPGYDNSIKSFPLYDKNPSDGLARLVIMVKDVLWSKSPQLI